MENINSYLIQASLTFNEWLALLCGGEDAEQVTDDTKQNETK
jgi:hypothetical protein